VAFVLRDPRFGRKAFANFLEGSGTGGSLLFQDGFEHARLRTLISKAFVPSLAPELRKNIEQLADGLLDLVVDTGAMDLMADFAFPLPVYVISELLGVPTEEREPLARWAREVALGLDSPSDSAAEACGAAQASMAAHNSIAGYFRSLVAERRKRPSADLLSRLIAVQEGGDRLTETEVLDVCSLLFFTGHQTTINLIGNGALALLRHPMEFQKLRDNPGYLPGAIEELLRYESPVQRAGRMANTDVEMNGKTIPKGAIVLAMLGAANRDPAQFPEPDRLDITRRENRHLAFGFGERFCLGALLARLEGNVAIGTLLRRLPHLGLTGDPPAWRNSTEIRGLKKLRITL
jgi:cytochrome P450